MSRKPGSRWVGALESWIYCTPVDRESTAILLRLYRGVSKQSPIPGPCPSTPWIQYQVMRSCGQWRCCPGYEAVGAFWWRCKRTASWTWWPTDNKDARDDGPRRQEAEGHVETTYFSRVGSLVEPQEVVPDAHQGEKASAILAEANI